MSLEAIFMNGVYAGVLRDIHRVQSFVPEQLMIDLDELSPVIREQHNCSRTQVNLAQPEFDGYKLFLSQVGATPSQAV
jgi:hypothetical protein